MGGLTFAHQHRYIVQMFDIKSSVRLISSHAAGLTDVGIRRLADERALRAAHSLIWSSTRFIDKYISPVLLE
jgi:hypothetical protein